MLGVAMYSATPALAAPSLAGGTGLIKVPTAEVLPEGDLVLGFSWVGGPRSYLFRPQTNRMYYASLGLLPGLEVTLDMLQVIGWYDPEAPGVAHAMHRLSHAKYQLPLPEGWPLMAIGTQDPLSANALVRGPVGQTRYGLTTYYGVLSQNLGPLGMHVGYATSEAFLDGIFAAAEWNVGNGFSLRAEYDTQSWNAGILWEPLSGVSCYGGRLFPNDWAYGTALTWRL